MILAVALALGVAFRLVVSSGPDTGRTIGDAAIASVDVVAHPGLFDAPLDAAPSPDGTVIYFVASGLGGTGVFSVPAGGGSVADVAVGDPFVRPTAVAVASDGSRLYVADPRSASGPSGGAGAILTVPTTLTGAGPHTPTVVAGTEGRSVRGLDVERGTAGDIIIFTGTDPTTGSSGVFQVPAAGGEVRPVAEGPPFASLDSVAVTTKGVVYASDRGPAPGQGQVFKVTGAEPASLAHGLTLGAPAGVALSHNDAVLLVSTLDAASKADRILFIDLKSGRTAAASTTIGANVGSSGGIHRSANTNVFAWADTNGQVYRLTLKAKR